MAVKIRRRLVMTGHDAQGLSHVASDSIVDGTAGPSIPGAEIAQIWGSDAPLRYPDNGAMPAYTALLAPLYGARLVEMYLAPHTTEYTLAARSDAGEAHTVFADERPGMHRTLTTDLVIVTAGRVDCQLDEETVTLSAGDVLIQNGTMHAWFNPYDEPCRFLAATLGSKPIT